MNYIIHPIWFYLMSIVDALKGISIVVTVLFGIIDAVLWYAFADSYEI